MGRSHELYSPSTLQEMGRTISDERALLTEMRPQVFSTSRRLSPPATHSDLFRSDNVLGVLPFKGFPSLAAEHLSVSRAPHDLVSEETAFRGLSSQRVRAHTKQSMKTNSAADPLMGLLLSRVFIPPATTLALNVASPHVLHTMPVRKHAPHGTTGCQSTSGSVYLFRE